jgi:hypothetical protein
MWFYGIGRVDASGRVTDRAVTCALGWDAGDRPTLTAEAGVNSARLARANSPAWAQGP